VAAERVELLQTKIYDKEHPIILQLERQLASLEAERQGLARRAHQQKEQRLDL
jgi:hypothetical protein